MTVSVYRGVAVAVMAVAVVAGCSSGGDGDSGEPEPTARPDGPWLTGLYRLDFDAPKRTALGQPSPENEPFSRRWAFRSHCDDDGCVATATRLNNDGSATDTRTTLDFINGKWVMVLGEDSKCNVGGQPARVLGSWVLEPGPDDTLAGTWTEITTGADCPWVLQMPLTVAREGDLPDGVDVTDPSTLDARKPTRPEGFQGAYQQTVTFRPPQGEPGVLTVDVATYCVRNTEECASTQKTTNTDNQTQITPLTFAGDKWTFQFNRPERQCDSGEPVQSVLFDEVMLPPEATAEPIPHLTGTRRVQFMEPCPSEQLFDLVYDRNAAPPPPAPAEPAPAPGG
ncbi:Rv2253/PknI dimerization domain-containing protein [Mycolicibacterium sp. XJ1819]